MSTAVKVDYPGTKQAAAVDRILENLDQAAGAKAKVTDKKALKVDGRGVGSGELADLLNGALKEFAKEFVVDSKSAA